MALNRMGRSSDMMRKQRVDLLKLLSGYMPRKDHNVRNNKYKSLYKSFKTVNDSYILISLLLLYLINQSNVVNNCVQVYHTRIKGI